MSLEDLACLSKILHVFQRLCTSLSKTSRSYPKMHIFRPLRALASFERPQRPQRRGPDFADVVRGQVGEVVVWEGDGGAAVLLEVVVVYTPGEVPRSFSAHANRLADSPALRKSRSCTTAASSSPLFRCVQRRRPRFTCIGASRGCTFGPGLWSSPFTRSPLSLFPFPFVPGRVLDLPVTLVFCKHQQVPIVVSHLSLLAVRSASRPRCSLEAPRNHCHRMSSSPFVPIQVGC
jgi:hypothetical protein